MHLVDTSVWVEFLRSSGSQAIQARLRPFILNAEVAITDWSVLELMTGLRTSESSAKLLKYLSPVQRLAFPEDGWRRSWDLASSLRKRGVTPTAADCFIATIALSANVPLIHCDADFEAMTLHSKLQTVDWTSHLDRL